MELQRLRQLETSIEIDKDGDGFICQEALRRLTPAQAMQSGSGSASVSAPTLFGVPAGVVLSGLSALSFELDSGTHWLVTGDAAYARQELLQVGSTNICGVDLVEVVQRQYGDLTLLSCFVPSLPAVVTTV